MVIGWLLVVGVVLVRQHLLDEGFYTQALLQADVYERAYTDVLADPELAHVKDDLVGRVDLDRVDPAAGRILATNSLRWAVPPSTLQAGTERFLERCAGRVRRPVGAVQDETPAADTVTVFAEAGLEPFLYTHDGDADGDWPTLGEMIDSGERLVVFAENEGAQSPGWYQPAFAYMQDTPFGFAAPEEMSCDANRGPTDASLLPMNHWVSLVAPDRQSAVIVNAHDFIVDRARACEAERGQLPNFVAVDFYGIGDVIGAIDTLNGVGA